MTKELKMTSSSGAALKGVRTRYRNILVKEISNAKRILESDFKDCVTDDCVKDIQRCKQLLKTYSGKLTGQMEKIAEYFGEEDEDYVEQVLDEDCEMNLDIENIVIDLEQLIDLLNSKESEMKAEPTDTDRLTELQDQMQKMMCSQMEQQKQVFAQIQKKESANVSSAVRLPKLELNMFSGNKLEWREFWDAFECSVHNNKCLSKIEKFNYLQSKLRGEARRSIAGLARSNDNYDVAVALLKERYDNRQELVDLHYHELLNIESPTLKVQSLRAFIDSIERHLRSLEKLGERVDQRIFVSMIRTKLPETALRQLEFNKGVGREWSIDSLRGHLKEYVKACENASKKKDGEDDYKKKSQQSRYQGGYVQNSRNGVYTSAQSGSTRSTTESLLVNNKPQSEYTKKKTGCKFCAKNHWSDECLEYKTLSDRKKRIKGSCFRCLKFGHRAVECKSNKSCVYCGEYNKHHRSLCPKRSQTEQQSERVNLSEEVESVEEDIVEENAMVSAGETVLMQTASSEVKNPNGANSVKTRMLFDSGSQRTYITEVLADKLGLKPERQEDLKIVTFGRSEAKVVKTSVTTMSLKLLNGEYLQIKANIVPVISGDIPRRFIDTSTIRDLDHLINSLDLADSIPKRGESSRIDLLIGNDYYLDLILSQKIEVAPGLYFLSSKLGWMLAGRVPGNEMEESVPNMLILTNGINVSKTQVFQQLDKDLPVHPNLEDFWNMESIGIRDDIHNSDDEIAMENFRQTVRFEDNRYHVTWPWKDEEPELPENKELAFGRLRSCLKKMRNKPELLEKYDAIIQDQLSKGIVEKVDENTEKGLTHYIPHHAVVTPQKTTTKIRVVYDASAKTSKDNKSLNECLHRGPVMLNDLCGLFIRFRLHPIALVSDIEKAFLQVSLQPSQRDVTRFLWVKNIHNPSLNSLNIQEYRFARVPFGVISSPFLLGATVETHLDSYGTELTEKLKGDIYVDNIITGADNDEDAIGLYQSAKDMFNSASMNLREWLSNSAKVNEFIPINDRAEKVTMDILGHTWDSKDDTFSLKQPKIVKSVIPVTKRTILQKVASVFDPMGLLSPVLIEGKVLLQKLWSKEYSWDDPIDDTEILKGWNAVDLEIQRVSEVKLDRLVLMKDTTDVSYKLLCFCDASKVAYATTVYLHQQNGANTKSDLLFAKTRLAPVKETTIPRLELMAVLIGVRSLYFVRDQVQLKLDGLYLWTDSQAVIGWINSDKTLPVFVKNRVNIIREHKGITISYVNTRENPADVATKGSVVEKLIVNDMWWHGPEWLNQQSDTWITGSDSITGVTVNVDNSDVCESVQLATNRVDENQRLEPPFGLDYRRYSSIAKVFRVTAFAQRFIDKVRKRDSKSNHLTACEIKCAEQMWIRYIQRKHYQEEFCVSDSKRSTNLRKQLGLYIDPNGMLRCSGRLDNADLCESAKRPLLLPTKSAFTSMMIRKVHHETFHAGVSQTLSTIRGKYWIPKGRSTIKSVLRECVTCRKLEGGPYGMPPFAPLPPTRVQESPPFSRTGVDYFGPLSIKSSGGVRKVWICLFTCMVIRAVHLEVVQDMTSEEFLLCLKRFISQRGTPSIIVSDNAAQFKLSKKVLCSAWKSSVMCEDVQSYVAEKGIQWMFIVELAPWMGGFYERLVGIVKRALRKSIGRKLLTLVQIQTLVKEVETVVNARPLVYVENDVNSTITLTPNHFLVLNPCTGIPQVDDNVDDEEYAPRETNSDKLLTIWRKGQLLLNEFWKIWREEYLLSLRERAQSKLRSGRVLSHFTPKVGDIVLIKDTVPRGCWKLGRIKELKVSRDKKVRSAKVQLSSGKVLGRPLNLLFPVECSDSFYDNRQISIAPSVGSPSRRQDRQRRQAAEKANIKIKSCV